MEEGDGVKQRRDEVGGDRESELKPVGLPAVRKREEGQRQLVQGAEGREQSRAWGMEGLRADQGWRFGRDGVDGREEAEGQEASGASGNPVGEAHSEG